MDVATKTEALALASQHGWRVFPVKPGDKTPAITGWRIKATTDRAVWDDWWGADGRFPGTLVGVHTGPESGIWVLDVDPKNGGTETLAELEAEHADWGDRLVAATPSGGRHLVYRYPTDELARRGLTKVKSRAGVLPGIDVRGHGGLIVAPGQDGREVVEAAEPGDAPGWLLDVVLASPQAEPGEAPASNGESTQYTDLVSNPPVGEGGRNNWLTAVAGHLAVRESYRDSYEASVAAMNRLLVPPLGPGEVAKLSKSIWETELAKSRGKVVQLRGGPVVATGAPTSASDGPAAPQGGSDDEELAEAATALGGDSGGLRPARRGGDRVGRLETDVFVRVGDKQVRQPQEWGDFDMVALGVTSEESEERLYRVELIRGRDRSRREAIFTHAELSDLRALRKALARFGCSIADPPNPVLKMDSATRLLRYLEAQGPTVFHTSEHLGYHDRAGAFLTLDGIITAEGPRPYGAWRPAESIRKTKTVFAYGHDHSPAEARTVLREILTFHHDVEASVFGAWWAATFLKHVAMRHSSLFPFMAIEAPSESGKTSGMFGMLVSLSGASIQSGYTTASFRDALAVNRSGVVWWDDPDQTNHMHEVLRLLPMESAMTKKGDDFAVNKSAHLVGCALITGEHLGFHDQKALADRAIHLEARSPTGRTSVKPGRSGVRQWDDILEFKQGHPQLSDYAGTLVRMALGHEEAFAADVVASRGAAGRRLGDKVAVLMAGARLLDRLTDDGGHADTVGNWIDTSGILDTGAENTLTMRVIPEVLELCGRRPEPTRMEGQFGLATPVLVRRGQGGESEVWVNPRLIAMWWERMKHGHIERRVETEQAFVQQLKALGATDRTRIRVDKLDSTKPFYTRLPQQVADRLLE